MKLHIGCGKAILPGWTNLDIRPLKGVDIQDDVTKLQKVSDGSCNIIYACHVFEHISRYDVLKVLYVWKNKLKPGGILRIAVPDFGKAVDWYKSSGKLEDVTGLLVGGQRSIYDYHKMVFDERTLHKLLSDAGFESIKSWDWRTVDHCDIDDYSQSYLPHMDKLQGMHMSLNLEGIKSK